ncbi:hypothetical protein HUK45_04880 [Limosilactobacillus sp. c9Ua_26_M]|uniref:Lipoprotein n=1 Tax=Limosilactobacillus urinaemulieris TaxID=2742600 RepID=A0ABR8ZJW2_9LACO|nr:hypothetical protein [Limosilactobacillus urinaemulieris]MBD8085583.1 hypothetical protein [Limosilactobacillus urinaemulieris]
MKKIGLICAVTLTGMSLAACGNQSSKESSSSSKASSSKVVKKHKTKQSTSSKKSSSTSSNAKTSSHQNQQTSQTQTSNNGGQQLTQGEINRQRGYDPNGAPLLPGQDHAAGSNPDGSPDAWVEWQLDWQQKSGGQYYPDGTPTPGSQRTPEENESIENDY